MRTTIDRFGRIVIPKQIREHLGLLAGGRLDISEEEGSIRITPEREDPVLVVRDGVTVYRGNATGELSDAVQAHRKGRLQSLQGDIT